VKGGAGQARGAAGYPGPMLRRARPAEPRPPRPWLALALAALVALPAWGQSTIAELSVTAFGRQRLDLASGRTLLEDGGELVDRRTGVRLVAAWIAYAEGVDVAARGATLDGALGRVDAAEVRVDLAAGRLVASGDVVWSRDGLEVRGDELRYDAEAGVAWLSGDVVAAAPDAAAAEVWVELASGRVLLVGPYRYAEGPLQLTGGAGSALQLDVATTSVGATYDARTDVEPAWRATVERLRSDGGGTTGE